MRGHCCLGSLLCLFNLTVGLDDIRKPITVRVRHGWQICSRGQRGQGAIHSGEQMVEAVEKIGMDAGRLKRGAEQLATRPRQSSGYSFPWGFSWNLSPASVSPSSVGLTRSSPLVPSGMSFW